MNKTIRILCFVFSLAIVGCNSSGLGADYGDNNNDFVSSKSKKATNKSTPKILPPVEYSRWILNPNNGLSKVKNKGEFVYKIQYMPEEYMVCSRLKKKKLTKEEYKLTKASYEDLEYFKFKIRVKNFNKEPIKYRQTSKQDYESRVEYYSFKMQNDVELVVDGKKYKCALFHFERDYGVSPELTFTMGFEKLPKTHGDMTFTYNERIYNLGKIYITITNSDLTKTPELKLS